MFIYLLLSLVAFSFSVICGFVFIPLILNFCKKHNLYDAPNARKIHKTGIPRLGGVSFLPSMSIAIIISLTFLGYTNSGQKVEINLWAIYFGLTLAVIYAMGLIDDLIGLAAKHKFVVQVVTSCFLPMSYLYINNFYGFCGINEVPMYIGAPLTVFVLVFIMNAINLIDGIDGLAGSLSLLSLGGFFYCFAREGIWFYCIVIAGLMGVLVPYLYFNIFGKAENNRKIFMGDSGSLTIGYILGVLLVKFSMHNPNVMPFRKDSMLLAVTLLLIPTFDVVRVIIVRLRHHKPIFEADKNHIHHKLLRSGMTQHQALLTILGLAALFIVVNIPLYGHLLTTVIVVIDILIFYIFHFIVNKKIISNGRQPFEAAQD